MNRIQRLLVVVVLTEVAVAAWGWSRSVQEIRLPKTQLNVLDQAVADDIRLMEQKHRPEQRTDWLNLAAVYRTFGLLPEAVYCYEQAQQRGELSPQQHFLWGICLSRLGKMQDARAHLEQVITSHHEWASDAWLQIGLNYLRQEDPGKAEQALRRGLQRPIAKLALARVLSRMNRSSEALELLEELLIRYPNGLRVHQLKAWVHEIEGQDSQAAYHRDRVRRAMDSLTTHDQSRHQDDLWFRKIGSGKLFFRSMLADQKGNLKEAIETGLQGLEYSWQEDRALRVVYLLLAAGEPQNALNQLERFMVRVGESVESLTFMGEALSELGRSDEAIKVWERAAQYRSSRFMDTNMRVHEKLKMAYEKNGEREKAARHAGLMQLEKAMLAWDRNEVRSAMIELKQAVELVPDSSRAWFYLAETRRLLGDQSGARAAYQQCLQHNPLHGRARRAIALVAPR